MRKRFLFLILLFFAISIILIAWTVIPHWRSLPGPVFSPPAPAELLSFSVAKPNLVARGTALARVEIRAIPTGTDITESDYSLLGQAMLENASSSSQTWLFPIPAEPVLATGIFAEGFDRDNVKAGEIPLPYSGATDLYNALWGNEAGAN